MEFNAPYVCKVRWNGERGKDGRLGVLRKTGDLRERG